GNLELVKELIALSANVEAIDWKGRTGLHYAAEKGFQDIAKALVGAGAKLDTKTSDGLSPLHCASWMGEDTAIALDLIAAGADLEARDNEGWTPLHTA
ncbi:ankyrin repeat-containing domain protein, partial [Baffinella frigidus]